VNFFSEPLQLHSSETIVAD